MSPVQRVRDWAIDIALPFWADRGVDPRGGFVECMALNGQPQTHVPRRVRAQARQVYVYAHAYNVGWLPDAQIAVDQMRYLTDKAWQSDGQAGWVHQIDAVGNVVDDTRDLYDHAFVLLALGTLYSATNDRTWLDLADRTIEVLDNEFAQSNGGFAERIGGHLPRRQNPHMHLFEAFLALHTATGDQQYLDRVDQIFRLFEGNFFDRDIGMLREFFTQNWTPWKTGSDDLWEPGHHCEWVWLLTRYFEVSGQPRKGDGDRLLQKAVSLGLITDTGLMRAGLGADNSPVQEPSRTWMQTEYIKALLSRIEHGDNSYLPATEAAINALFCHHLDPACPGTWIDHVDETGQAQSQDIPSSSLYHLICCMTEIERVLGSGSVKT